MMERNRILRAEDDKGVSDGLLTNLQIVGYETVLLGDGEELSEPINYNKITFYRSRLLWSAF
jgi:DNA-binding NtrC family response regulator